MTHRRSILALLLTLALAGCASAPDTRAEATTLEADADQAIRAMTRKDPTLEPLLARSAAYVVFPTVGEGGFVAGAAIGTGVLYENDLPVGYVTLNEGSLGAQVGGQAFTELIVFRDREEVIDLRDGDFSLTADAGATIVQSGAAASATFDSGTAVFVDNEAGAMLEASVGGQALEFEPRS